MQSFRKSRLLRNYRLVLSVGQPSAVVNKYVYFVPPTSQCHFSFAQFTNLCPIPGQREFRHAIPPSRDVPFFARLARNDCYEALESYWVFLLHRLFVDGVSKLLPRDGVSNWTKVLKRTVKYTLHFMKLVSSECLHQVVYLQRRSFHSSEQMKLSTFICIKKKKKKKKWSNCNYSYIV